VHLPLADDPTRPPAKRVDPILGRRATTRWRVLATRAAATGPEAVVELEPVTGRGHQLRVHLAWLGCPILGDRLYGPRDRAAAGRLALHAAAVGFPHPADGRPVRLVSPPLAGPWDAFPAAVTRLLSEPSAAAPSG